MTFRQGICEPPRFGVNDCWTTSSWRILQLSLWNVFWPLIFDIMFDFSTIETTCVHQSGCFSSLPGRLLKHWRTHWLEVMEKIALCRTGGNRLLKLKLPAFVGWRALTRFDSIWGTFFWLGLLVEEMHFDIEIESGPEVNWKKTT